MALCMHQLLHIFYIIFRLFYLEDEQEDLLQQIYPLLVMRIATVMTQ